VAAAKEKPRDPAAPAVSDRKVCMWNSARQLGRSHWESDTVLHVEVVDDKNEQLLASAEVPLRCVGEAPFELGAEAYAPMAPGKGKAKGDRNNDDGISSALSFLAPQMPPCSITLWCVPPAKSSVSIKHLFLITPAESALTEAFSVLHPSKEVSRGSKGDKRSEGSERRSRTHGKVEKKTVESESSSSLPRADARAAPKPASEEARVRSAGPVSRFGAMLERGGQAVKQLKHSVTSTDHPLSRSGLMQASALQANIAAAMRCIGGGVRHSRQSRKEMTDAELEEHEAVAMQSLADADVPDGTKLASVLSTMLHAQTLWASPLARATQTAMLVLQPFATENSLNENEALPIELKRNARERRELTSLTTSIGNSCGEHIRTRCVQKLMDLKEEGEAAVAASDAVPLLTTEVESQWWSTNPESDKEYQTRVAELMAQIQFAPDDSIVLVAHNDLVQELLSRYMHPDARERLQETIQPFLQGTVPPCTVLWCCLDFQRQRPINDAAVLNDTIADLAAQQLTQSSTTTSLHTLVTAKV